METSTEEISHLRSRLERLEALHLVGQIIHSTLDLKEALSLILREAVRLMRASSGSVCLLNPNTGCLEIEAEIGLPAQTQALRLRLGEGVTGWVARHGRAARVPDVRKDPRYVAVCEGVRSELAVPLRVGDDVRGVINVDSDRGDAFTEADQTLLQDLATLAAPAISNTWLYEQVKQKARLLESLVRVGQVINSTISLDEALQAVVREAKLLLNARMVSLMMVDGTGEWLELRAHLGAGGAYVNKPKLSMAESFVGIVVRRRKPVQLENVQSSGRYQNAAVARAEGLASLLSAPLLFGGKAMGVLNVYSGTPHRFSDEEVRTLMAYAELSALALEKARLYERIVAVEESLRESERLSALGLLAAEVAHEIRNPLTVIKMLHHSMARAFAEGDPRSTDVRIMGEKMDHMNRIVDRVLDFARSNEPDRTEVQVNQLIDDLALLTRQKLRGSKVILVRKLDPRVPAIMADATQLEQALLNLTFNAVEAMPNGGRLSLRTRLLRHPQTRRPDRIVIRFRDTGVGMNEEQRRNAFTSLLRTTKPKGTGLGLAIVARVVEQHQGVVRLWSRLGKGTTISVILPASR
jgi:signal transduction histidine kinase